MTEAELFARHHTADRPGGEPLYSRDASRALIEDAAAHCLAVLGVDGARLDESRTRPDLTAILDLSGRMASPWDRAVRLACEDALTFLDHQPPDLLFSIVFAKEGEF